MLFFLLLCFSCRFDHLSFNLGFFLFLLWNAWFFLILPLNQLMLSPFLFFSLAFDPHSFLFLFVFLGGLFIKFIFFQFHLLILKIYFFFYIFLFQIWSFFFWFWVFVLSSFVKCLNFFLILSFNQLMLFPLLFFSLAFGPHSFIFLFIFVLGLFYQIQFFFQFHPLTLKCYFSSYFVLISDLIIFFLILSFCFEFFYEMFGFCFFFNFTFESMCYLPP